VRLENGDEFSIAWTHEIIAAALTETNPRVDRSTALEILAGLEFDPDLPCEHQNHGKKPWHEGPGELLVHFIVAPCNGCGRISSAKTLMLCKSSWENAGRNGLACITCGESHDREHWWQLAGGV
jgi:hypothetical protein